MSYSKLKFVQRVKKGKKNLQHVKFGLKNFATRQILKWNFYIALHFELKFYNVSDFKLKIFTTCQNIKRKFFKKLDLELNVFRHVGFGKKCLNSKNRVLAIFTPWNLYSSHFFSFLKRNIWNQLLHNLSDFELKKNTTRENLNWIFCIASDFDMKFNNVLEL